MNALAGTGTLIRFAARRERVRVPVYLLILVALIAWTAAQSDSLYSTQSERDEYARTVAGNPGLIAIVGPAYAVTNAGGDTAWQWGAFGAVTAALMSMFIVGRHTRGEEQSGRSELIRASVVGRYAATAATMVVVTVVNVLLAALVALAMIGLDQPAAGSIALGASLGGAGLLFAGVAVVAMQVNQSTGGAYGLVGAVLGRRTCCARPATSATARSPGSRRSGGRSRCGRTRTSAGGRCCCSSAARGCSPPAASPC
jgi:ABC-2 type transport system permease protein